MKEPLTDIVWKTRGISVLWDVEALASLGPLPEAISLRDFFLWHGDDWSPTSPHARDLSQRRCLVVAT